MISNLKQAFEDALYHSQEYPFNLNAGPLLEQWKAAKSRFIKAFGRTIWRSKEPIKIALTAEIKRQLFNNFIKELYENNCCDNSDLDAFISNNEDGFFRNRVTWECSKYNIRYGEKLLKSLKNFPISKNTLRTIQDIASKYIQEDKIEGYLYLSVDPLDFLTISENNASWTSCHALDGDYRGGNLNYMVDDVTVIAYLASDKYEQLKCFPEGQLWNSKKWRMLVHIKSDSTIYYNKQYPFSHDCLLQEVHSRLTELLHLDFMSRPEIIGFRYYKQYDETWSFDHNMLIFNGEKVVDSKDYINYDGYNGYLDLVNSHTYLPIVSYNIIDWRQWRLCDDKQKKDELLNKMLSIHIGAPALCPCCGKHYTIEEDSFLCNDCIEDKKAESDFYCYCSSCGKHIYDGDYYEVIDNETFCDKCLRELEKLKEDESNA